MSFCPPAEEKVGFSFVIQSSERFSGPRGYALHHSHLLSRAWSPDCK